MYADRDFMIDWLVKQSAGEDKSADELKRIMTVNIDIANYFLLVILFLFVLLFF
jgi:hypothetical protein